MVAVTILLSKYTILYGKVTISVNGHNLIESIASWEMDSKDLLYSALVPLEMPTPITGT